MVNHCAFFYRPGWDTGCLLTWTKYSKNDACGGKHILTIVRLGEL